MFFTQYSTNLSRCTSRGNGLANPLCSLINRVFDHDTGTLPAFASWEDKLPIRVSHLALDIKRFVTHRLHNAPTHPATTSLKMSYPSSEFVFFEPQQVPDGESTVLECSLKESICLVRISDVVSHANCSQFEGGHMDRCIQPSSG